jgi:eukaryotic-like serine/threonine-protein kinase
LAVNESGVDKRILRFAAFEVDLRAWELRKRGIKIPLPGQSFQVLELLLERPGDVVTREELRHKLWPADTFVDFDQNLNAAVKRLRRALNDSADSPRLIETLPRRGYRLIVPVSATGQEDQASTGDNSVRPSRALSDLADSAPKRETKEWLPRRSVLIPVSAVVLVALVLGVALWIVRKPEPKQEPIMKRLTSDVGLSFQPTLSPDGKLVAFASDRSGEGHLDIWLKQVEGGDPIRLTRHPLDDYEPDFSPDGTKIVFRSDREGGGVYVILIFGGDEKLIAKKGRSPRFSPDGKWIAYWVGATIWKRFTTDAGRLYVIPATGGRPRQLQAEFISAGSPVWSPDGNHLLFLGEQQVSDLSKETYDWWVTPLEDGPALQTGAFDVLGVLKFPISFPDMVPGAAEWIGDQIVFYARLGDSVNLWQAAISTKTWKITGAVRRLSSGSAFELHPSVSWNGRLVFASLNANLNIWSLPVNAEQHKIPGELRRLTENAGMDYHPSVSADGKRLVFTSLRSGDPDVWIKDLDSGKETALVATPLDETSQPRMLAGREHPEISPDGSKIGYTSFANQKGSIHVLSNGEALPLKVGEAFTYIRCWSPDGKIVFKTFGAPNPIELLDPSSGKRSEIVRHPSLDLFSGNFSPDGRWLVFEGFDNEDKSRIFVGRYRGETIIPEKEWIEVTDGSSFDDKPRWSPNGNAIYFVSKRDGFLCLWTQPLDPATKRTRGVPLALYHFHSARHSLSNQGIGLLEISVARDKLVFSLHELTGNIWMTELKNR